MKHLVDNIIYIMALIFLCGTVSLILITQAKANPIQDEVDKVNARIDNVVDVILQSYTNIDNEFAIIGYRATKASRFFGQATAGAMATSSIDFGSVSKGETEVGMGAGVSASYVSTVYAGAIAVKHGLTDKNAITLKGWKSDGSSYSIGVGTTYKIKWR